MGQQMGGSMNAGQSGMGAMPSSIPGVCQLGYWLETALLVERLSIGRPRVCAANALELPPRREVLGPNPCPFRKASPLLVATRHPH